VKICRRHAHEIWEQARIIGLSGVSLKVQFIGLDELDSRMDWLPCIICETDAGYAIEATAGGPAWLRIRARVQKKAS
jgi:hypothetical protein